MYKKWFISSEPKILMVNLRMPAYHAYNKKSFTSVQWKFKKNRTEGFFYAALQTQVGWSVFKVTFKTRLSCITLKINFSHSTRFMCFLLRDLQIWYFAKHLMEMQNTFTSGGCAVICKPESQTPRLLFVSVENNVSKIKQCLHTNKDL